MYVSFYIREAPHSVNQVGAKRLAGTQDMENSSRFFRNTDCAYFPCHRTAAPETFNCLFCYCPLYFSDCPGSPRWTTSGVKDCSDCRFPHRPENYDAVLSRLSATIRDRAAKRRTEERAEGLDMPPNDLI